MTMRVQIDRTIKTPEVRFRNGKVTIYGRSILEDSCAFYTQLVDLLNEYTRQGGVISQIDLCFEYLNCSSTRSLVRLLKMIEERCGHDKEICINWHYFHDDDSMLETGDVMRNISGLPINMIEVTDETFQFSS